MSSRIVFYILEKLHVACCVCGYSSCIVYGKYHICVITSPFNKKPFKKIKIVQAWMVCYCPQHKPSLGHMCGVLSQKWVTYILSHKVLLVFHFHPWSSFCTTSIRNVWSNFYYIPRSKVPFVPWTKNAMCSWRGLKIKVTRSIFCPKT